MTLAPVNNTALRRHISITIVLIQPMKILPLPRRRRLALTQTKLQHIAPRLRKLSVVPTTPHRDGFCAAERPALLAFDERDEVARLLALEAFVRRAEGDDGELGQAGAVVRACVGVDAGGALEEVGGVALQDVFVHVAGEAGGGALGPGGDVEGDEVREAGDAALWAVSIVSLRIG